MKIFEIYNSNLNETFYVHSLYDFCEFNGLTERLLRYTHPKLKEIHDKDKNIRWQPYHKGFKIVKEFNDKDTYKSNYEDEKAIFVVDLTEYYRIPSLNIKEEEVKKAMKEQYKQADTNSSKETYDFSEYNTGEQENTTDEYLVKKYQASLKTIQKLRDENNLLRKSARETFRGEQALEEIKSKLYSMAKDLSSLDFIMNWGNEKDFIETKNNNIGILVLSDWHIGKLVNLDGNKFSEDIAVQRLNKLYERVREQIYTYELTELRVVLLGDFIHAQSRPDMKYQGQYVEIESGLKCFYLIKNLLDKLYNHLNKIEVDCVVGNESRFDSANPHTNLNEVAKNSIDYMIYEMLYLAFKENKGININKSNNYFENLVDINGFNLLAIHGDKINHSKLESELSKLKYKIYQDTRKSVDYIVMGHIHSALITDGYSRNASLVGADEYATRGLNIPESYVSQLFGVLNRDTKELIMFSLKLK
uniref:DNA polymerase II small subunit n=1 Tax=Ackermannviridae sp. ctaCq7 TaxID=2827294 RepID=A0A8S5R6H1_9CAUD|nr:MAG TPA: DNA polymerase II small subunit [Ackermannviridae sp. ctaCq7]